MECLGYGIVVRQNMSNKIDNVKGYKILTKNGFESFDAIVRHDFSGVSEYHFSNDKCRVKKVRCTPDHKVPVFDIAGEFVDLKMMMDLTGSDYLLGDDAEMYNLINIELLNEKEYVFDLLNVGEESVFFANGLLVHNCEFVSSDALLIESVTLNNMEQASKGIQTKILNGVTFYKTPKQGETYIIGVDPSTGSGNDFSVIQIFHFPSMEQIGEMRSNSMSSGGLYAKIKWLLQTFDAQQCTSYFSVENNGVGEGIVALYMNDENPPSMAEMISESQGNRLGMNTNVRTKMKSCINLKEMLEKGRMKIYSPTVFNELKNFVRKRGSYQAQIGSTDDCISAVLIVIRILEEISTYEQGAFEKLYTYDEDKGTYKMPGEESDDEGGYEDPLPMMFG